jgi:hypothetical protein
MTPALPLGFGSDLDPTILLPPPPNPIDPNLVTSDSVALQHEATVASYINNRQAEIATLNSQLSTCAQDVKAVVCQTLQKLQSVNEVCGENPDRCPSGQTIVVNFVTVDNTAKDGNGEDPPDYLGCSRCQMGLLILPHLVNNAQKSLVRCDEAKNSVQAELNLLETFLSGGDPLQTERFQVKAVANQAIDVAATARQKMNELLDDFAVAAVPCRHDELVASSNECSGQSPSEPPPLIPTGKVRVEQSTRNLGRLAAAFRAASDQTTDSNLRARYAAVSERLRRLNNAQVLNVTAPSNEPFTQSFIALRRVDAPDDGRSPIGVVLTLVGSRRPCPPELNFADRQLLDQALQSFKNTLLPGRECATCLPPR